MVEAKAELDEWHWIMSVQVYSKKFQKQREYLVRRRGISQWKDAKDS
jgi:hypothetical protein